MQKTIEKKEFEIIKSSGLKTSFSLERLRNSLKHSGADDPLINTIVQKVFEELYDGISTKEIYNRAFALLKKNKSSYASRYKLKKAIYELGPTGFPFEKFIGTLLEYSGYKIETNVIFQGNCVPHEIDVVARKNDTTTLVECKFHGDGGHKCNVKIPLYIHSRYQDIKKRKRNNENGGVEFKKGWVVTNTRFTKDAVVYGKCANLYLVSWDYPANNGLKDRIDRLNLYPITVSTILRNREKQFLLSRDIVLCRQLLRDTFYLDHLGMSATRKEKVFDEISTLCTP